MTLKDELNAEENSFLIELRTDLSWNHNSFINLLTEINNECERTKDNPNLSRDIASGIWYISDFIKSWTQHDKFPKVYAAEYYELAYELINDLAYYYFMAESPYQSENEIEDKISQLKKYYITKGISITRLDVMIATNSRIKSFVNSWPKIIDNDVLLYS